MKVNPPPAPSAEPSRADAWRMFDRIAPRYDALNRILSFGIDRGWRRRMVQHLPPGHDLRVLDLATGTADQVLALMLGSKRLAAGVGMDLAERMLERGRVKIAQAGLAASIVLERGDACDIPAPAESFDVVTISFGIRNVMDVSLAFREMLRVLRPGGRVLVLEFSLPRNRLIRAVHLFYLRHLLPRIGGLLSGDGAAYRYLNQTIETFPHGAAFCEIMERAGFTEVRAEPLTFGIATLYQGDRPARTPHVRSA